jgi:serine phosphatase RsbU (regulator of sigma subunit)
VNVTIARAGHPPLIVLTSAQAPAPVAARGDLVGVWSQVRLQTSEIWLAPGDLIVAYSDGATDFSSGASPAARMLPARRRHR